MENIGDMYLAAALLSYGCELLDVDKTNVRRQKFLFNDNVEYVYIIDNGVPVQIHSPKIKDIEMYYFSKKLVFPPQYPDCLRSIKSSIHSNDER
jgi:hypothetical protein